MMCDESSAFSSQLETILELLRRTVLEGFGPELGISEAEDSMRTIASAVKVASEQLLHLQAELALSGALKTELLTWRLAAAEHEGRVELVDELHGGVQQTLAAILVRLSFKGESVGSGSTREIRDLVRAALDSMDALNRTVSLAVHSLGLTGALRELSVILQRHTGFHLETPDVSQRRYPGSVEVVAYEAIRTLVMEFYRQGLSQVSVSLHDWPGSLRIIVEFAGHCHDVTQLEKQTSLALLVLVNATLATEVHGEYTTMAFTYPLGDLP